MLDLIGTLVVAALTTAPQSPPDCRVVNVYFESERGDLSRSAESLVDAVYGLVGTTEGSRVTAALTGHIDGAEQANGLTALDEERVAAVWSRLQALRTGRKDHWSFTVRSVNDTEPAYPASGREPRNRRVELSVCPDEN